MNFGAFASVLHHLNGIDADTTTLLVRVIIRAAKSGNLNAYLKSRLERILDEDDQASKGRAR